MFLVSALRGITAVTVIDGRPVGRGSVGALTTQLATAYRKRVITETTVG